MPLKVFKLGFLKRKTHSTSFIPEIDGMRFFAIITVVLFHLNTALSRNVGLGSDLGIGALGGKESPTDFGWWVVRLDLGVKVFFAISGFVLALPFLKQGLLGDGKKINIKDYFLRRLTRLEPPFVLSLLVFLLVHVMVLHESWSSILPHFWAGLGYAHVFVFGEPNPINPVTWSLEVEAQFYILVPLLFWLLFKLTSVWLRLLLILGLMGTSIYLKGVLFHAQNAHLSSSILSYFINFGTGILFAWIFVMDKKQWLKIKSLMFDLLGFVSVFVIFYFYKPQHDWMNNMVFNVGVLGFMLFTFKGKLFNYFFTRSWVYIIGGMCYSIYLLHYAFFHLLIPVTSKLTLGKGYLTDYMLQILVAIPIMLLVSVVFYVLIERPCMDKDWPKKLLNWVR